MNLAASEVFDTDDIDVEDWMVPQPVVHTDTGNPKHHVETAVMSGATDEPLGRQEGKTLTWRNVTMTLVSACAVAHVYVCCAVLACLLQLALLNVLFQLMTLINSGCPW